jgi:hypothetical protein
MREVPEGQKCNGKGSQCGIGRALVLETSSEHEENGESSDAIARGRECVVWTLESAGSSAYSRKFTLQREI